MNHKTSVWLLLNQSVFSQDVVWQTLLLRDFSSLAPQRSSARAGDTVLSQLRNSGGVPVFQKVFMQRTSDSCASILGKPLGGGMWAARVFVVTILILHISHRCSLSPNSAWYKTVCRCIKWNASAAMGEEAATRILARAAYADMYVLACCPLS